MSDEKIFREPLEKVIVNQSTYKNDNSSCSGSSYSSTSSFREVTESEIGESSFTPRENLHLNRSKILVYLALTCASIIFATFTYYFISKQEVRHFEDDFLELSESILFSLQSNSLATMTAVESLSLAISADIGAKRTDMPNFTLPFFEERSEPQQVLGKLDVMAFAPIVVLEERQGWESYASQNQDWIREGLELRDLGTIDPGLVSPVIKTDDPFRSVFVPLWQMSPAPRNASIVLTDLYTEKWFNSLVFHALRTNHPVVSNVEELEPIVKYSRRDARDIAHPQTMVVRTVREIYHNAKTEFPGRSARPSGFAIAVFSWVKYFEDLKALIPHGNSGIYVNVHSSCGTSFSYKINGSGTGVEFLGMTPTFEQEYSHLKQSFHYGEYFSSYHYDDMSAYDDAGLQTVASLSLVDGDNSAPCAYSLDIFPSKEFQSSYETNHPFFYSLAVVAIFFVTMLTFASYDWASMKRQNTLLVTARHATSIVQSAFPKNVQSRLLDLPQVKLHDNLTIKNYRFRPNEAEVTSKGDGGVNKSKPIADLFPDTTIMFADIAGFTAWSSIRDPAQVFTLLETIFTCFDQVACRRRVFKVETVGDCYVAVCGVPEARNDHATAMARFAFDCLSAFSESITTISMELGPDTTDLGLRIGLHSGPVTGGVLRGERARFQLFGDTMNTASRIESTGLMNKIHVSQETANQLIDHGKGHWISKREDLVVAKGKGEMQTYWLNRRGKHSSSSNTDNSEKKGEYQAATNKAANGKNESELNARLVDWVSEILTKCLKKVIARRIMKEHENSTLKNLSTLELADKVRKSIPSENLADVITLPSFRSSSLTSKEQNPESIQLPNAVIVQLRTFVQTVAAMYRSDNPFHNFEHISHVTMSVTKLLSRIVAPTEDHNSEESQHDHTYGITSDPLTQFAVMFAALIHDVDHQGITNAELIKAEPSIANFYQMKSVAEQNSFDLAWDLLLDEQFEDLRRTIYTTEADYRRFRQLVVNAVMATDIMDKEVSATRKERWYKAFHEDKDHVYDEDGVTLTNRRATIVIEHIIQASDVVHTMQHWHIFRKWNERLFLERYKAFKEGRSEVDPSVGWYDGEIGFFDYYIIPLARKLKSCGVFGVSSDECLNYAQNNRREWEMKGREVVAEMIEKASLYYKLGG